MSRAADRIARLERVNIVAIVLLRSDRGGRCHRSCLLHPEERAIDVDPFVARDYHRLAMIMHMSHSLLAAYGSCLRVVMRWGRVGRVVEAPVGLYMVLLVIAESVEAIRPSTGRLVLHHGAFFYLRLLTYVLLHLERIAMVMLVTLRRLLRLVTRLRIGAVNDGFARIRGRRLTTGHPLPLPRCHYRLNPHMVRRLRLLLICLMSGVVAALQATV